MKNVKFLFLAAVAAIVCCGCLSTPQLPMSALRRAASVEPDALAAITAERYGEADTVAVFQWESTCYEADGTYETTWTSIDKILTDRGLEKCETMSFWNNDFYGSTTVLVARVHSRDGTVREIDLAANLAEAIDTGSLSSNIHDPNDKTWTLAFPGLEVGDTVETTLRRTVRKPRIEGVYADWLVFEQTGPVLWQGFQIDGPIEKPLRSRALRDAEALTINHAAETNKASGRIVETWVVEEETPRFFSEPEMPPAHECTARLLLSTAENWEAISAWYARLCEPHLAATNAAMAALAADRTAGMQDRDAKIRALFDFVSREVRYMGAMAESEAPGYEPHDVSLTFDNRYGVCRDKAALLVALLRMAGIDAWPTLVHVGEKKDRSVPQPWFNHAIVAVATGNSDEPYMLMDPTSETTRSLLPEYLCEKSYLVARAEGETIRETPPLPVEENLMRGLTKLVFSPSGSATGETTLSFGGINDVAYRGSFASIPKDSIRAFCQRILLSAFPGAVLTGWSLSPEPGTLRTDLSPLSMRISYTLALVSSPFDPPRIAEALAVASRTVGNLGLERRRFPFVTDYPCGFDETIAIEGAMLEDAHDEIFEAPGICYENQIVSNALHRSLRLAKSRFSPSEYASLRELRETQERADKAPVFWSLGEDRSATDAPVNPQSDRQRLSEALESAVAPEPQDDCYVERKHISVDLSDMPHSWTITTSCRTKILTYAGQRAVSDVEFSWQPAVEDLELVDARTISADGTETPVNPALDVFDGDQAWVADAPRYPAGRLKTVSFPKVAPGATVQYSVRRRKAGVDFFSCFASLGSFGSFGEHSFTVTGPERWRDLFVLHEPRWPFLATTNDVERTDRPDSTTWTLRGGGPGSAVATEGNSPGAYRVFPTVEASTMNATGRTAAIRDVFFERSDPATQTGTAAFARTLVPPDATVAEKVRAIRDWTDLNLRAAGPDWTTLPLKALSGADETFNARYGHSADRQIVRLAMARAMGLAVSLRFYNSDWNVPDFENPLTANIGPSGIDSVSIVVYGPSGTEGPFFLDGASRFAPLPFDLHRDSAFVASSRDASGQEMSIFTPPPPPQFQDGDEAVTAVETTADCSLREDGSGRVRIVRRFRGSAAEEFRRKYSQMLPEERRRDAQKLVAAFSQSARLASEIVASHPAEGPCELKFEVEVPDLAVKRSDGSLAMRVERAELFPETAPRRFPFCRTGFVRSKKETLIRLPEGWIPDGLPADAGNWSNPEFGIQLERVVAKKPDSGIALRVCDTLCLGPAEFPPERYVDFLVGELSTQGAAANTATFKKVGY